MILSREVAEMAPGLMGIVLGAGTYGFAVLYARRRRKRLAEIRSESSAQ